MVSGRSRIWPQSQDFLPPDRLCRTGLLSLALCADYGCGQCPCSGLYPCTRIPAWEGRKQTQVVFLPLGCCPPCFLTQGFLLPHPPRPEPSARTANTHRTASFLSNCSLGGLTNRASPCPPPLKHLLHSLPFFLILNFVICMCTSVLPECMPVCLVPEEASRGRWIPWN